jgi:hypothetical protein
MRNDVVKMEQMHIKAELFYHSIECCLKLDCELSAVACEWGFLKPVQLESLSFGARSSIGSRV